MAMVREAAQHSAIHQKQLRERMTARVCAVQSPRALAHMKGQPRQSVLAALSCDPKVLLLQSLSTEKMRSDFQLSRH